MNDTQRWTGPLPEGWTGGDSLTKWWRGAHVHLYTLKKPCQQCKAEMRIDVTAAALEGKAANAGIHLKRCPKCRAEAKAVKSTSRPRVDGQIVPGKAAPDELERLHAANETMKEELEGLYAQNKELRARLNRYELAPALEAVANDIKPVAGKMPWER